MSPFDFILKSHVLGFVAGLAFLPLALPTALLFNLDFIPAAAVNGSVVTQFTSSAAGLDSPKQSAINGTVWDWWYFDVVGTDHNTSIVLVFSLALSTGFIGASATIVPSVSISGTFPNGTAYGYSATAAGGAAVTTTSEGGASGNWIGTGFSWVGSADMSQYVITIDAPAAGIEGTITLHSKAPAHYPCGPNVVGSNLEVGPNIGWANAIPDAKALVNLQVGDTLLKYTGVGYHDKNWGGVPFPSGFNSWYWGHARFGNFSIVWFDFYDLAGTEHVSAYVSYLGHALVENCTLGSITVRPIGTTYPPTGDRKFPTGFKVSIPLGPLGTLNAMATVTRTILGVPFYDRWIGTVTGSLNAGPTWTGVGLWEEINLLNL